MNQAIARGQMRNAKVGFNIKTQDKDFAAKYAGESEGIFGIDVDDRASNIDPAIESLIEESYNAEIQTPFISGSDNRKANDEAKRVFRQDLVSAFEQCYAEESEVLIEALENVIEGYATTASEGIKIGRAHV